MSTYNDQYAEVKIIGRGSYGTAYIIKSKATGKEYVAKKIPLEMLNDKEKESSILEASIIKSLQHPHIVSYTHSFYEHGNLIIVMEYCSKGDLSVYIKLAKERNVYFAEKDIMNWFA